jgi:RNAse (barnase) inhibitor barstar
MQPVTATIDCAKICDWPSFHSVFADVFAFPSFYGRNMDAWVDCMSSLDVAADGLSSVHCAPGTVVTIHLLKAREFMARCPDLYAAIVECSSYVNWRRMSAGQPPILSLAFHTTHVT